MKPRFSSKSLFVILVGLESRSILILSFINFYTIIILDLDLDLDF